MSQTTLALLGIALILFGVLFVGIGLKTRSDVQKLLNTGTHTTGRVVGAESRRTAGNETYATYDVVEFTALDGKTYQITSAVGWVGNKPQAGATVPVIYDLSDPAKARINTTAETQLIWILFTLIGILLPVGFFVAIALTRPAQ